MKQNIKTDAGHDLNQQKVFHHLRLADILLIVLPMALVIITLLVFTVTCGSDLMCVGVALASFIIAFLFCVIYGALSLILSLLTRRNITFRIGLVASVLAMPAIFYALFVILSLLPDGWLNGIA